MPRLFAALEIPVTTTSELAHIQPSPKAGIRLVDPGQMHLTLHYIGEAELEEVAEALRTVTVSTIPLAVEGVGQFPSADGAVTLWAGVRENSDLLTLRDAIATALVSVGFRSEARPYNPHVALARCDRGVPARVADEFVAKHKQFSLPSIRITEFGLYSSEFVGDVPKYRREQSFLLRLP